MAYRYYFYQQNKSALYASPLIFYKDYSFNHAYIIHQDGENSNKYSTQIRSSKKDVYGGKLLLGYQLHIPIIKSGNRPIFFVLNTYVGIGLRYKTFADTLYATGKSSDESECNCLPFAQPKQQGNPDDDQYTGPGYSISPHLGARIGVSF